MRILLAAKYTPSGRRPIGGVQSWVRTVRADLERRGHECVEREPGMWVAGTFDLGIVANWKLCDLPSGMCRRIVNVSHGIIPDEAPMPNGDVRFVSEGVRGYWGVSGPIIRQPIDLGFWRPTGARRSGVVRYSYRGSKTLCADAAKRLGEPYRHVRDATPDEAREILAGAAVVFASGRAALESMACGAPTVICDHRSAYQGPLMDTDLERQMRNSYSGRGGVTPTLREMVSAAERAIEAGSRRSWIEAHHDARCITGELIA